MAEACRTTLAWLNPTRGMHRWFAGVSISCLISAFLLTTPMLTRPSGEEDLEALSHLFENLMDWKLSVRVCGSQS